VPYVRRLAAAPAPPSPPPRARTEQRCRRAQVCWKWRKVVCDAAPGAQLREFLDTQQYSTAGILKYERVCGDGFVSTGGVDTTRARPAAWPADAR
jgi:hypothetical protein